MSNGRRQGVFWLLTIPSADWQQPNSLPDWLHWLKGQRECGETTGYEHWQIICAFAKKVSLRQVKEKFGTTCHAELTRSEAAGRYVWKDDTAIPDTRFELGAKPILRSSKIDWENVWDAAKAGTLDAIPANIRICHYRQLLSIGADHSSVPSIVRSCTVYWGPTGTGKSRRAWDEAGLESAYCKDPRTKFWCGYQGQGNVVIDEFRGGIDISHFLRWLDRYPVRVEVKGGSRPLLARSFWITSNLPPRSWYPDLDLQTFEALERRLNIINLV